MIWGLLAVLAPFISLIFWFLPGRLDARIWHKWAAAFYVFTQIGLFLMVIFGLQLHIERIQIPKLTYWIWLYALFLMFYLAYLVKKWSIVHVNKALTIGILSIFIAADVWELPIFAYGGLGVIPSYAAWVGSWADQIHRFYVIAAAFLLTRLVKFKFNGESLGVLILMFVAPWLFLLIPGVVSACLARAFVLFCMGWLIIRSGQELAA